MNSTHRLRQIVQLSIVLLATLRGNGVPDLSGAPAVVSASARSAAGAITTEVLRAPIAEIASDSYGGRGPASAGDVKTRAYLVDQLRELGLEPGGPNGGWEQPFDLVGITSLMPETWTFKRGDASFTVKWWDQYIAGSGVQEERAAVADAEVVFVGYGIQAPEYGWDDFKGRDLKGKVLLMLNNDPDWDPDLFAGPTRLYYGRWTYKYESASRQGAAGAIIIHTTPSAGYPFQVVQTSWTGEQFELPAQGEPRLQLAAWLTEDASRELARFGGQDLGVLIKAAKRKDFEPVPLGVTTALAFSNRITRVTSANVGGLLPGSDPVLKKQVVIYTAHHDHLGVGKPDAEGDAIYNGALDNAAGVAQVLGIARAFKALPHAPRRSVLFLFVGAEEQGLLGSEYYANHPTFSAGRIAANLNYDGGNIWGRTRDLTFIGKGKSSLDGLVEKYAAFQEREVKPDQFPDRGYFYRSDQMNFVKIGVPATFLDGGMDFVGRPKGWGKERIEEFEAKNYHQPSDELNEGWNFEGMIQDARLGFWVGLDVANGDQMPSWNPGDEFEAARQAALAAERAGGD